MVNLHPATEVSTGVLADVHAVARVPADLLGDDRIGGSYESDVRSPLYSHSSCGVARDRHGPCEDPQLGLFIYIDPFVPIALGRGRPA